MGKHLDLDINQIKEYWETTSLSIQEIADKMNTKYDNIRSRIKKYNFIRPDNLKQEADNKRVSKIVSTNKTKDTTETKISISKQQIIMNCCICGKEFELSYAQKQSYVNQGKREFVCGKECKSKYNKLKFTQIRPKVLCCICGKEFELSTDQLTKYNKGQTEFYCSQSCIMKKSLNNIDLAKRKITAQALYNDTDWVAARTLKTKQTNLEKYGVDNQFKREDIKLQAKVTKSIKYNDSNYNNRQKAAETFHNNFGDVKVITSKVSAINKKFFEFIKGDSLEYPLDNYNFDIKKDDTLIEIDPSYTHNSLPYKIRGIYGNLDKDYHFNKSKCALDHNYKCIHIFDWDDWNKILYLLQNKQTLYARKLSVKSVPLEVCNEFINKYHLQNSCKGQEVRLGLYLDNELVEIMTFGKPRYNKNYAWELLRLCTKPEYKVVGGAEKLFKHFILEYKPHSIVSYCDFSKFSGEVYTRLGFKQKGSITPSKHWSKGNKHITDNLLRQRGYDQLFNANYGKGTSNEELMIENGWLPIYDCGQITFIWKDEFK